MKREIEFRGKKKNEAERKIGGEWHFGMLFEHSNEIFIFNNGWDMGLPNNTTPFEIYPYEVIPETVGQYTGLKDDKGAKIFEGDIVKDPKGQCGVIFWKKNDACFAVNWKMEDGTYETDTCIGYGEVIGNIHDNPELLEKNNASD
jgi:uncharacterized phage protein (TIGR01671 family)